MLGYEQSVFLPEILRATGKVNIMHIRERNGKGMRRDRKKLDYLIILLLLRIRVFASHAGKRKRLLAV